MLFDLALLTTVGRRLVVLTLIHGNCYPTLRDPPTPPWSCPPEYAVSAEYRDARLGNGGEA